MSGNSYLEINEQNQSVTFTLNYWEHGSSTAETQGKVLGDFNYWDLGKAEPMLQSPFRIGVMFRQTLDGIPPGFHQYKYYVRDGDQARWWNAEKREWTRNSTFLMPGVRVLSSRNLITPGGKVYFAAQFFSNDAPPEFLATPAWSVEPLTPGIAITAAGILSVDSSVAATKGVLTVKATANGKTGVKKIALQAKDTGSIAHMPYKVTLFVDDYGFGNGWNLWAWENGDPTYYPWQCNFAEKADLGMIAGLNSENFLVRRGKGDNAFWEQTGDLSTAGQPETYVVGLNGGVYNNFSAAVRASTPQPRLMPLIDSQDYISVLFSHVAPHDMVFDLYENGNKVNGVVWRQAPENELALKCVFPAGHNFDPAVRFEIRSPGLFKSEQTILRKVLDNYVYAGNDLGATYTPDKTTINLRLWAPTASNVSVMTYNDFTIEDCNGQENPMLRAGDGSGTWTVSLDRSKYYNQFYKYKVVFHNNGNEARYAVDPYANAVCLNGTKGALVDLNEADTKPFNWAPARKPYLAELEDAIIYEVHVRDFTIDQNSGVKDMWKGRYLGFVQEGATHPGDSKIKTGIDHLAELGITHVHLLPVYDYGSVKEELVAKFPIPPLEYNWGYDPMNYNVPEGGYSTNPSDPKIRIIEFRQMVQALHDKNLRVIMDGVYNHAYETDNFDHIVPQYYFRTDDWGKYLEEGSKCGNEIATERPMVRKFIVDSVMHWINDYSIDGFRFDLMGLIDIETMLEIIRSARNVDDKILFFGEPWAAGEKGLATCSSPAGKECTIGKGIQRGHQFGIFNDHFRDSVRGGNSEDFPPGPGYVTGATGGREDIFQGVMGSVYQFADDPEETINYVACHDNYPLWDQITKHYGFEPGSSLSVADYEKCQRAHKLALGIILTSQGIVFIHAGDEFLRTKFGTYNSYQAGDDINKIRWDWKRANLDVFNYFKGLIKLRKEHPVFHLSTKAQIKAIFQGLEAPDGVVAFKLQNSAITSDAWNNIMVMYNPHDDWKTVRNLGPQPWYVVTDDTEAGTTIVKDGITQVSGEISLSPRSMSVLTDVTPSA
jgi:type I pullulanase